MRPDFGPRAVNQSVRAAEMILMRVRNDDSSKIGRRETFAENRSDRTERPPNRIERFRTHPPGVDERRRKILAEDQMDKSV